MSIVHGEVDLTVNQIYLYDQAVRKWVVALVKRTGGLNDLNVIFATPERAFAKLKDVLQKKYGDRAEHLKNMPYPYASISRLGSTFSPVRYQGRGLFRANSNSADNELAYTVQWPLPWDMNYQIDFWARTVDTAQTFQQWFEADTTPEGNLLVDLTPVWPPFGKKIVFTTNSGITDNTILEPEGEQRAVRLTATLTVKSWILMPPVPIRTVHRILVEAYNAINSTAAEIDAAPSTYPSLGTVTVNEDGWV